MSALAAHGRSVRHARCRRGRARQGSYMSHTVFEHCAHSPRLHLPTGISSPYRTMDSGTSPSSR